MTDQERTDGGPMGARAIPEKAGSRGRVFLPYTCRAAVSDLFITAFDVLRFLADGARSAHFIFDWPSRFLDILTTIPCCSTFTHPNRCGSIFFLGDNHSLELGTHGSSCHSVPLGKCTNEGTTTRNTTRGDGTRREIILVVSVIAHRAFRARR